MIPVFTNYRLIIDASERFFLEILFPAVIIKGTQLPDISFYCLSRHIMNYYFKQSRIKATADHMDKFVIDSSRPVRLTSEIYQKSSGSLCINFYQPLQKFLIISRW